MQRHHHLPIAATACLVASVLAACGAGAAAPATTGPAATVPATTVPTTTVPAASMPVTSTTVGRGDGAIRELLASHDDGTQFVGAVVAFDDGSGATSIVTAGHPSLSSTSALDPDVAWNIGSVTKTFVAVVVLQLADEGRLDLDAGIDPWFPDLAGSAEITSRQLLQHTSGLAEYIDLATAEPGRTWTPTELIALAESRGRTGEPGAAHSYANTNYIALGEIIEQLTGHAWSDEVDVRVVRPLGLTHTRVIDAGELRAPAHSLADGAWADVTADTDPSIGGAAGALESTAADLLRFTEALGSGELLPTSSLDAMETFVPGEDYSAFGIDHGYGLGLERYASADVTVLGHMGVGAGQSAFIGFDREHGTAVAVQFNADVAGPQAVLGIEVLTALA